MAAPSSLYSSYVLGVLLVVMVINFVDRQLMSILIEPIKAEFGASDREMGLLTGFAFALFYTVAGIPVARLADVWVRRSVIAIALAAWSAMTALTGVARTFTELALIRIGVGIGEAGGTPPSHALISDYFPRERRTLALAVYSLGIPIGTLIGYPLGGWLAEQYGWRATFVWMGLPGIALALLVRLTVREPPRGRSASALPAASAVAPSASVLAVLRHLFSLRTFRWLVPGVSIAAFSGYGFAIWKPVFLMRVHDFSLSEAGLWIGISSGSAVFVSTLASGFIADWLARRNPSWALRLCAFSILGALPFHLAFLLHPSPMAAIALYIPGGMIGGMWAPPSYAAGQNLAPVHMRALSSAILLFFLNLIGLGLGPFAVGWLSDVLAPRFGAESLRWALVIPLALNVIGALCYVRASRSYARELVDS